MDKCPRRRSLSAYRRETQTVNRALVALSMNLHKAKLLSSFCVLPFLIRSRWNMGSCLASSSVHSAFFHVQLIGLSLGCRLLFGETVVISVSADLLLHWAGLVELVVINHDYVPYPPTVGVTSTY
jgi:hypothetical protein